MDDERTEFSKLMEDPQAEYRKIVYGDIVRRAAVWQRKGVNNRTICEGILEAALDCIYEEDHPQEWLWFFRRMIEQAESHRNRVESALLPDREPPE